MSNSPSELTELLADPDCAALAANSLRELGAETTVPALLDYVESAKPGGEYAVDVLNHFGVDTRARIPDWIASLSSEDAGERHRAASGLAAIGADAVDAVPALTALIAESRDWILFRALERIGPSAAAAIPALIALPAECKEAFSCLVGIGSASVQALTELLDDPDKAELAALALGRIGAPSVSAVSALLDNRGRRECWDPRWALCRIGGAAVPFLVKTLQCDPMCDRRVRAANALGLLKYEHPEVVTPLLYAAAEPNEILFEACREALVYCDREGGPIEMAVDPIAVPWFEAALENGVPRVQIVAAATLALGIRRSGGNGGRSFPDSLIVALARGLRDPDRVIRRTAAQTSQLCGVAIHGIEATLNDDDSVVRASTAVLLCKIGQSNIFGIVPALKEALQLILDNRAMEWQYRLTLDDIEEAFVKTGVAAVPVMMQLFDNVYEGGAIASRVLRGIGSPAIPEMRQAALARPELSRNHDYLLSLFYLTPSDVMQKLTDCDPMVRLATARVLCSVSVRLASSDVTPEIVAAVEQAVQSEVNNIVRDELTYCLRKLR